MRVLLIGSLLGLVMAGVMWAWDQSGRVEVLAFGWAELVAVVQEDGSTVWAAPAMMLDTPCEFVGVSADESGVKLAVDRTWEQGTQRFAFVFGIGACRHSRFWKRLAVGTAVGREGRRVTAETVVAWECSENPVLEDGRPAAETGMEGRGRR